MAAVMAATTTPLQHPTGRPGRPRAVAPYAAAPYLVAVRRPTAATFWRRRLAALIFLAVSTIAAVQVLSWFGDVPLNVAEPASAPQPVSAATYVVQPGDTLWSIARSIQPTGEVRPLVDRLSAQVGGRALQTGDRIVVP